MQPSLLLVCREDLRVHQEAAREMEAMIEEARQDTHVAHSKAKHMASQMKVRAASGALQAHVLMILSLSLQAVHACFVVVI